MRTLSSNQYTSWIGMVRYLASQEMAKPALPRPAPTPPCRNSPGLDGAHSAPTPKPRNRDVDSDGYLQKRSADGCRPSANPLRSRVCAGYLPAGPGRPFDCHPSRILLIGALPRGNFPLRTDSLALLVTTGSALTLFPQYFFFRPDTPHLSEFMAPFLVAMACALWVAFRWSRKNPVAATIYCASVHPVCSARRRGLLLSRVSERIVRLDCRAKEAEI